MDSSDAFEFCFTIVTAFSLHLPNTSYCKGFFCWYATGYSTHIML